VKAKRWFDEGGTRRVRTVLGLSKTSTSVGWVLVNGRDIAGDLLDHDVFDVVDATLAASAATARRARDIATATGYAVDCIRVTSSDAADTDISSLRKALIDSGFREVVTVPLLEATRAWAQGVARTTGTEKVAVCVLDDDSASLSVIDTRSGAIKTKTINRSHDSAGLIDWLNTAFDKNGSRPVSLYLIGSRSELGAVAGPLGEGLSIPVVATHDAQLALARGAAFWDGKRVEHVAAGSRFASHARTLTVVAAVAVVSLVTLSSAGGPIRTAEPDEIPASAPPVVPMVLSPPPTAAAWPAPDEPRPASTPASIPVSADIVAPEPVSAAVSDTVVDTPPIEHLPDVQPVQHIPDAQPAGGVGPAPVAPGPAAPPLPAPPPPTDPLAGLLSPLFGGLP
jgi:hypothetical protein